MSERFVAIDFETANSNLASICQVGMVTFEDGNIVDSWSSLSNPEDYFDWINVDIHGINEFAVKNAPTFPTIYAAIVDRLTDQIVVSHTSFDRTALFQASAKYGLAAVPCRWLDSARVVRRAWTQWSRSGYGLVNVCSALGIHFTAHNAVEDARAAGEVLIHAMRTTAIGLNGWMTRVDQPIDPSSSKPIAMKGNPDGALAGEEVVFTGTLALPRREAAALAAAVGCEVTTGVKKTTTLLVVGDQDVGQLAGYEKSIKQRKAEELISKGRPIRILTESDFLRIVDFTH
ncbi:Exonuclease-like protein [Paraburkholderia unamae]|uniref:exonuclease domain-containing protein n=1 Tax=Paraburkholderia unamae TaxID=219649 RepID=UPI001CAB5ABE|nr:exonuclease domain-containing protein [Paraburkholderia unamae]CAG9273458.1 Exonuclease-like protein [Paraburkholderia unamae]